MSVAAKPQQANRCWPRAYLIPPGIIIILVSHAFDPRYRAHVTLLALGSQVKGRLRQILPPSVLLAADVAGATRRHRTLALARNESQPRPRWSLAAEALRWENGDKLVLLVVLVTCRSASTSISPPSARRLCKKQHCSSVARHRCCIWPSCLACLACQQRACARGPQAHCAKETAPRQTRGVLG